MTIGTLQKLKSELNAPVDYYLPVGDEQIHLNPYLGKAFSLKFTGRIICENCGNQTKKSFSQGYCFPCMKKLARCDMCIMKPETCHFHQGTCREPEWGERNCFVPHYVYLSNTSGLKVGITRHTQIPTRWIDQGATQALPIFRVATRQQSGFVETTFKNLIADKTNWRAMLKGDATSIDLQTEAVRLKQELEKHLQQLISEHGIAEIQPLDEDIVNIEFPVLSYPDKIKSHNFDKDPLVHGVLHGIKGQYLLFDTGVINIRKFTSYEVEFSTM